MNHRKARAFTLIELLVVMAVILVLVVVTLVAVRALAQDARQTRAVNAIKAALGTARAEAMRLNKVVGVVVRGIDDGESEIVIVVDSGGDHVVLSPVNNRRLLADRFEVLADTPRTRLSRDVRIFAPYYRDTTNETYSDDIWIGPTDLGSGFANGQIIGVFFQPNGTLATIGGIPEIASEDDWEPTIPYRVGWVDFDGNGAQGYAGGMFEQTSASDEVFINSAPILAIIDYRDLRDRHDTTQWSDVDTMRGDISGYVAQNGTIIQFNRYTGVMTK